MKRGRIEGKNITEMEKGKERRKKETNEDERKVG